MAICKKTTPLFITPPNTKREPMKATIETITPEIARAYLEMNTGNFRKPDDGRVARYSQEMASGNWEETGDSIKFAGHTLLDGQHRLIACVKSGASFSTIVVRDAKGAKYIDRGKPRTIAQWLRHKGIKHYNESAAICRAIACYDDGLWGCPAWKIGEYLDSNVIEFAIANKAAIQAACQLCAGLALVPKPTMAAVLLIGTRVDGIVQSPADDVTAKWFVDGLKCGSGLTEVDAVLHLRNRMVANLAATNKYSPYLKRQIITKAWNMTVQGLPCRRQNMLVPKLTGPTPTKPIAVILNTSETE